MSSLAEQPVTRLQTGGLVVMSRIPKGESAKGSTASSSCHQQHGGSEETRKEEAFVVDRA